MKLAAEEITVSVDGERIVLRPTLRRALRLERRHDGFENLVTKIQAGDLRTIADVLREHSSSWSDAAAFLDSLSQPHGIAQGVEPLIPALIAHVYALAGVDLEEPNDGETEGRAPSLRTRRDGFAAHLVNLFSIGTGWLGWSHAETWDSTPAEIRAAQAGLVEFQNALRGVAPKQPDNRTLDDKFADVFLGLATRSAATHSDLK